MRPGRIPDLPSTVTHRTLYLLAGLCLVITLIVAYAAYQFEQDRIRQNFKQASHRRVMDIENGLHQLALYMDTLGKYMSYAGKVDHKQFSDYYSSVLAHSLGIHAMAWAPQISATELTAFQDAMHDQLSSDYTVMEIGPSGERITVRPRSEYYPVSFVEPAGVHDLWQGLDTLSESNLHDAVIFSLRTGKLVFTAANHRDAGSLRVDYLAIQPVFKKAAQAVPDTMSEPAKYVTGLIIADINGPMLFKKVLPASIRRNSGGPMTFVYDHSVAEARQLIYPMGSSQGATHPKVKSVHEHRDFGSLTDHKELTAGGHTWHVINMATSGEYSLLPGAATWSVMIIGLLISVTIISVYLLLLKQIKWTKEEIDQQTKWLRATKENLEHEIEDREVAERKLRSALQALNNEKRALDAHAIVCAVDTDNKIYYVNDKFIKATKYEKSELIGKDYESVNSGCRSKTLTPEILSNLEKGEIWHGEVRNCKKNGGYYWADETIVPFMDDQGTLYQYVIVQTDISARKESETQLKVKHQQLVAAHAELEQSHSTLLQSEKMVSIGQLAAGIAHEINTPTQFIGDNMRFLQDSFNDLTVLLETYDDLAKAAGAGTVPDGLAARARDVKEEVEMDYLKEEIPKAICQSLEGIERVANIVRSMKEFSHPGSDEKSLVDINKAIETTVTISRNEWKYCADLTTDFDPALVAIPCLLGEFNQVILNMIVNAAHAIQSVLGERPVDKGTISIVTKSTDQYAEIRISDTGSGIPEDIRSRIFDPFFTTKSVGKGTGQGLAVAYNVIVGKHGGRLEVESKVGQGSTFIICLPMVDSMATDKEASDEETYSVC